jgi:hypothetical protein
MKKTITSLLLLTVILASLTVLTSCDFGIKIEEGKLLNEDFFDYVAQGDLDSAAKCLYPIDGFDIWAEIFAIEESEGIRFSDGVQFVRYFSIIPINELISLSGPYSELILLAEATVGNVTVLITTGILKDSDGYGICHFEVTRSDYESEPDYRA